MRHSCNTSVTRQAARGNALDSASSMGERYRTSADLAGFLEKHDRGAEAKEILGALFATLKSSASDNDRACADEVRRLLLGSGAH